jgi:hypothetical protein
MTYFQSNIRFLTEYNHLLLERLQTVHADHIESVRIGDEVVFKLTDEQGKEFYSASIYDPVYEAEQFLDGVNFDNTGYILLGIGSSAIVKRILENKTETAWVFIIEKDLALVKKFLEEVDLAPYLEGKLQRVVIFSGELEKTAELLNAYFISLVGYYFLQADFLRTFATYRRDRQYYEDVICEIINQIRTHMTAMGNSIEDTLMGMTNELKNLPVVLTSHRLIEFKQKYQGKPIICVASGPSLDKQLPLLKEAKGKALIICAESAFRVLIKNGISPDIVCILERGTNSYDLSVKGVEIPDDTALFGLTLMDERIPKVWNSFVVPVFKENITHSRFINRVLGDYGSLYSGNSVAHLNYSLAHFLGGSPIVFIGQDLAYSEEGKTHSKDSFYIDQEEMTEAQRKQIQDSLQNEELFFNKTVYVDGYYGGKVKSRELWRQFLHWMEHLLAIQPSSLVINATEGGAHIKGTVQMPFREVLERYCTEAVPSIPEIFADLPPLSADTHVEELLRRLIEHLNETLGKVEQVAQFAEEILQAADQLQEELKENRADFLEMKACRILRNMEQLVKEILDNEFCAFFYRPLLSNYHVKMNPISRVSSIERLQQILTHQCYLLKRVIEGKEQVIHVYQEGISSAVKELGFDPDEIRLDVKAAWDLPEWMEET